MAPTTTQSVRIPIDGMTRVSGLLRVPEPARACYVLAHGAGAGMAHPFMTTIAEGLAARHIATLRYQFPYMERGAKRPDAPSIAQATVRAAVAEAARLLPDVACIAGGKSFGGRMTSLAQARSPIPHVRGLVFLGFPLHPAGRPSNERGQHLLDIHIPMLFLQGARDRLGDAALLQTSSNHSVPAHASSCFKTPIIRFTCPREPDERMPRCGPICWMGWGSGSRERSQTVGGDDFPESPL